MQALTDIQARQVSGGFAAARAPRAPQTGASGPTGPLPMPIPMPVASPAPKGGGWVGLDPVPTSPA